MSVSWTRLSTSDVKIERDCRGETRGKEYKLDSIPPLLNLGEQLKFEKLGLTWTCSGVSVDQ